LILARRLVGGAAATAACLAATVGPIGAVAAPKDPPDSADRDSRPAQPAGPTFRWAWRARIVAPAVARAAPSSKARPRLRLGTAARWNGGPVGLLVLGAAEDRRERPWLRVLLPQRPNGTTGWIPASRTVTRHTGWRVAVNVDRRTVSILYNGRVRRRWGAVVGAPGTPTPRGLFAIGERVRQPSPYGFLGTWALHLTAYSGVLDNFGGGPGTIGIHGRGGASFLNPLGSAASHGCIRIDNGPVGYLARRALEGTPVRIR
jgi:lipoprotein-anchoring transpeptidase ErfK/SrfK